LAARTAFVQHNAVRIEQVHSDWQDRAQELAGQGRLFLGAQSAEKFRDISSGLRPAVWSLMILMIRW
jgi:hypothetical protein